MQERGGISIIENRKEDHLKISADAKTVSSVNYWDRVMLYHNCLPEMDLADVELGCLFLGSKLDAPLMISGMTGGCEAAEKINANLASAASRHGIAMGVGSQRAALEKPGLAKTYSVVKRYEVPFRVANIGIVQLSRIEPEAAVDMIWDCVSMIDAHACAVYLNFLQETIQPDGEPFARNCLETLRYISKKSGVPIIAKETGAGIGIREARFLGKAGVSAIDVGGVSGTSFAAIESRRAGISGDGRMERLGDTFRDWGIPAPFSLLDAIDGTRGRVPVIAGGGLRNGLDCARALSLGADIAGMARALLAPATTSEKAVFNELNHIKEELRTACFLTGSRSVYDLSGACYGVLP